MALVSDIEIRLRADIARLQQDMNRARQSVSGAVDTMKKSLAGLAVGFSLVEIGRQVIQAQREFDKLNASLITATGSVKGAGEAMKALQSFAASTPYSLAEVTEGFLKLRNLGLTPSERALNSYGNTASAMGKSLTQLVEAVADATTGEFERLKEFGIKAKQQGDQVSLTFQGVTTKIGNNAAEIEEYLTKIGEVNFAGGMKLQADTLDGAISALGDTWSQTLVAFSQSGFGDQVRSGVMQLSGALTDLQAMFKAAGSAADDEGDSINKIGPLHAFLTTAFEALTVLGINLAHILKTIGGDIGAIGAAVVQFAKGDFQAARNIIAMRIKDGEAELADVNARSAAILGAAEKARAARAKEAADLKKSGADRLEQYKIVSNGVKTLTDEEMKAAKKAAEEAKKNLAAYNDLIYKLQERVNATAREVEGLAPLTEAEKAHLDLTKQLSDAKLKLTSVQEKAARSLIDEAGANESLAKQNKEWSDLQDILVKNAQDLAQERYKLIDSAREEAEQNEFLVETFGMAEEAIIRLRAARLLEQEAQRLGRELTAEEIADLNRVIELKERSAEAVANRRQLEETKQYWTDIEKTARDTFVSIADGGKNAFQRLKDTAKNVFFDWLYQQTLKKWIINIGTSVAGTAGVSGIAGAATGTAAASAGGGIGNALSAAAGLGSLTSGVGLLGAGGLGLQAGFGALMSSGLAGVSAAVSGGIAAIGAGTGASIAAGMGTIAGALGPIALGIGGAVMLLNKAFGRGSKELTGNSTLTGSLTASEFAGAFQDEWKKKGGWFSSSKTGFDTRAVDAAVAQSLGATYQAITSTSADYARMLGINADAIANRTQSISIAMGKDESANQKAIADFFTGVANTVAGELLPGISKFQMAGEEASTTLQRLATNYTGLDQVLAIMGSTSQKAFGAVGIASLEARERLIALAGGVEALAAQTEYFNQNFLSQAEQIKIIQGPLNEQLAALGYAGITTADQFKEAVQGLAASGKLATEDGAKTYAGLLALGPQFKTVADYLQGLNDAAAQAAITLANNKRDLEIEIMELSGDTLGALAARRAIERAAADESLRPLIDRIHALQDEKAAAEAATLALEKNEDALRRAVDTAFDALSRAVDAQREKVTSAYQETMARIGASIAAVNVRVSDLTSLSNALKGGLRSVDSDAQQMASRGAARAQIQQAIAIAKSSGMLPSADDLKGALEALNRDATDQFSSLADYQREVARTNVELETLGGLTDKQLTDAQQQLRVLEDQKALTERQYEAEMAYLDGILGWARAEVDAINGVDRSVQSVVATIAGLKVAGAALGQGATPTNPTGSNLTVEQLYRTVLGREGERAGIEFWKNAFGDVVDAQEYKQFILGATPELEMQDRRQREAAAAMPMSGTMSSSSASNQQDVTRMNVLLERIAASNEQFATQFSQVSGGGNALLTEPM